MTKKLLIQFFISLIKKVEAGSSLSTLSHFALLTHLNKRMHRKRKRKCLGSIWLSNRDSLKLLLKTLKIGKDGSKHLVTSST